MKSLVKRACFFEGSTRAVEAYKAEVASLTFKREPTCELRCDT